jgi:hypothetical protein
VAAAGAAASALGKPGGINNTAYLFFVLALAFLFYITVKGDLPKWLGLLGLGGSAAKSAPAPAVSGTAAAAPGLPALPGTPGFSVNNQLLLGGLIGAGSSGVDAFTPAGFNLPAPSNAAQPTGAFGQSSSDASNPATYG